MPRYNPENPDRKKVFEDEQDKLRKQKEREEGQWQEVDLEEEPKE